jgi:hypothetical protein
VTGTGKKAGNRKTSTKKDIVIRQGEAGSYDYLR